MKYVFKITTEMLSIPGIFLTTLICQLFFCLSLNEGISKSKLVNNELPQGSFLATLLLNAYISESREDIPVGA